MAVTLALYALIDASISQRYELSTALNADMSLPCRSSSKVGPEWETELEIGARPHPLSITDIFTLDLFEAAPDVGILVSAFNAT